MPRSPGRAQPFILGVHSTASPSPNAATNYGFALDYNQVSRSIFRQLCLPNEYKYNTRALFQVGCL